MFGMTSVYLNGKMSADELKATYRRLVRDLHPDLHPEIDDSKIKTLNNEYAYYYARAASSEVHAAKTEKDPSKDYSKYTSASYIESIEAMIAWLIENNVYTYETIGDLEEDRNSGRLYVDLVGVFIWIGGIGRDDIEIRNTVKSAGFQGSVKFHDDGSREYMWKWTPEIRRFGSNANIDDIYRKYGKTAVTKGKSRYKALNG